MLSGEILHKDAYLYRVHDGIMECEKGYILWYSRGDFVFRTNAGYRRYTVTNSPEIVYWDNMWVLERDDNKARELFNEYYEAKIAECQAKISRIQDKMIVATTSEIRDKT